MTFTTPAALEPIAAALTRLAGLWAAAGSGLGEGTGADPGIGGARTSLGAGTRVEALAALGALRAAVDAVTVQVAGALEAGPGVENPATVAGHRNTASFLAELWRISYPVAKQFCAVGAAVAPGRSLVGAELPARYPVLADALDTGGGSLSGDGSLSGGRSLSVDQIAAVVRELEKASPACSREDVRRAEALIVDYAPGLTVEQTRKLAAQVRDRLDQDGIEPREAAQRRGRSLTIRTTRDGMTRIDWLLDAESAGYVLSGITALTGAELRGPRFVATGADAEADAVAHADMNADPADAAGPADAADPGDPDGDAADGDGAAEPMPDPRTLAQLRSDAAVEVFRHLAGCAGAGVDHPPVTMLIRIGLDALESGVGVAEIDGVPSPVSAGTARRLAADAHLIPVVLGQESEVLDLGRRDRLFSTGQKRALAERDGGCAWAGCPHPPGYTQAHHIRWWHRDTGPTDLSNGILLCSHHHHRVHADGWDIQIRQNVPWFIPPPHIDPTRRPRRGGRLRTPRVA